MREHPRSGSASGMRAKAEASSRLSQARRAAGLTFRDLEHVLREEHGHQVSFPQLARVESGKRRLTRELAVAWAQATGQADPRAWAEEVIALLGEQGLGRRRVLPMRFQIPDTADVPEILMGDEQPSRLTSPEAVYARVITLLGKVQAPGPGDDQPVLVTTLGPLAVVFCEVAQTIAPAPIVANSGGSRRLVHLVAAPTAEDRVHVVEEALAASAHVVKLGLYEPLVKTDETDLDIVAVPGAGSAVVLGLPGGGYLWVTVPPDDYQHLREYLEAAIREARDRRTIELADCGRRVSRLWFGGWEGVLLEHEETAEERLFLQPQLGLLTQPAELATRLGRQEAKTWSASPQDIEDWVRRRAERIAIFRRKLRKGQCQYRDLASSETLDKMADDGYSHVPGIYLPAADDPGARLERLNDAHARLVYLAELLRSEPGYELRLLPRDDDFPPRRLWSLVRSRSARADVLLTFTFSDEQQAPDDRAPTFVNAVVRDEEVSKRFREDFEQLWGEAPGRDHTLEVLREAIGKLRHGIDESARHNTRLPSAASRASVPPIRSNSSSEWA